MKKISLSLIGIFAFLFAGVFFVGCGVDYGKISLRASESSIELEVGQSADITFTIDGFQKGFSNKIQLDVKNSGQTQIVDFEEGEFVYVSDNQIKVSITGKAGGSGTIVAKTLEGGKQCEVSVFVNQNSNSMEFDDRTLYVSNSTPFVPSSDMFIFDANTTNKQLSYYYIKKLEDFDFETAFFVGFDEKGEIAQFNDGRKTFECEALKIEQVKLEIPEAQLTNKLVFYEGGAQVKVLDLQNEFDILAVYDFSVDNEDYERIVYDVATVNVLPDIDVEVSGGYFDNQGGKIVANGGFGYVDFKKLSDSTAKNPILIVPNNSKKRHYLIKVEMQGSIVGADIEIEKLQNNNFVDVDFFDYEENAAGKANVAGAAGVVYYFKVSHNSQRQAQTEFAFNVFYDIAQGISDESVNATRNFVAEIQIAPNAITVNGTTEPDALTLYNYYKYPEFGWNELLVDVVSGFDSSANHEGVYLEFDETYLDVIYDGVTVKSGADYTYTDLSVPFYVRGKYGVTPDKSVSLVVHAKSSILENEQGELAPVTVECKIIAGATEISVDEKYEGQKTFFVDFDGGQKEFDAQLYANQRFQSVSYRLLAGVDVVDISAVDPCLETGEGKDKKYYLNLKISPNIVGVGVYRIFLDNGTPIDVTFTTIKTLSAQSTTIKLSDSGNEAVTEFSFSRKGAADYDNVINIDVLNVSDRQNIYYGSYAYLEVLANVEGLGSVKCVANKGANVVTISEMGQSFRFTTRANGTAELSLVVSGQQINDFIATTKNLTYTINLCAYSLVSEYYLKNGDDYAINNTVYFGANVQKTDSQAVFSAFANKQESNNFYRYEFGESAIETFYEWCVPDEDERTAYNYVVESDQTQMTLDKTSSYDKKFIYFFVQDASGAMPTMIEAKITKRFKDDNGRDRSNSKNIRLSFGNGVMFKPENFTYVTEDENEKEVSYSIEFENAVFSIGSAVATFDVDNLLFEYLYNASYSGGIVLQSNLRQPNQTKKYNASINTLEYQSVKGISLATNLTGLDFSNDKLVYELGVYTYPTNTTNKNVRVEFVRTNNNRFSDMVKWEIDSIQSESGLFTIRLSCEDFYEKYKNEIVDITDYLTGKIYIYPADWGDSYTEIGSEFLPITLDVQYRNGSKANPYLIENADDVLAINTNAITLKSHYEISTVIDMAAIQKATPIGILNGTLVGFSGSLVGSNSQAAITNILVTNSNFVGSLGGQGYYGLFAKLNETAEIQNVQFSGSINISTQEDANISLVTAINQGYLINVGANISGGRVESTFGLAVFGGVAAVNNGLIVQDFSKYDGTEKKFERYEFSVIQRGDGVNVPLYYVELVPGEATEVDEFGYALNASGARIERDVDSIFVRDYSGQNPKNLAYYNDFVVFEVNGAALVAGGVVGVSSGLVQRISAVEDYKIYGYGEYSSYSKLKVLNTSTNNVAVGGAVGAQVNKDAVLGGKNLMSNVLEGKYFANQVQNLLVGGEIFVEDNSNVDDSVGGIVGYLDTNGVNVVYLTNNISRTFVRGNDFVGAILGFEKYASTYSANLAEFGKENIAQAVDDGRNIFHSAMLIKYSSFETNGDDVDLENAYSIAIGNGVSSGRNYLIEDGEELRVDFVLESYLQRKSFYNKKVFNSDKDGEKNVTSNAAGQTEYYGDFLIVEANTDAFGEKLPTNFKLLSAFKFDAKDIVLNLQDNGFKMTSDPENDEAAQNLDVYFMQYFHVSESLVGAFDAGEKALENLNVRTPNSGLYPFELGNNSVNIEAVSTNIISIDANGQILLKGTGLATIQLTSILNVQKSKTVYLYITNYFDKSVASSIFYTSNSTNGINVGDGGEIGIYGSSTTSIHLVPDYTLSSSHTYLSENDVFSVSKDGVLTYQGVSYKLQDNSNLTVEAVLTSAKDDAFSKVQINKQTIVFYRASDTAPDEGAVDEYCLVPILRVEVQTDDGTFEFFYELQNSEINLDVNYRETATAIRTQYNFHSMQTNNFFREKVYVSSENEDEMLFYQIVKRDGTNEKLVQQRLPLSISSLPTTEEDWKNFLLSTSGNGVVGDLFDLEISKTAANQFGLKCSVNAESQAFLNRFEENIYGEYVFRFYANELENGVSCSFRLMLNEAEINYVSINNYSNLKDVSETDLKVVPTQRGLLEISIDPAEAVFEKLTVSNNAMNYLDGAAEASFAFVYKKEGQEETAFVEAPNFGKYEDGKFVFTYQEMIDYYAELEEYFDEKGESETKVTYGGKVYVSYYMPSKNVDDSVPVAFDVEVDCGNEKTQKSTILLKTKLNNFAKLSFVGKDEYSGVYYVARGLSYNMKLSSYGFEQDQISIEIVAEDSSVATLTKNASGYVLNITSRTLNYNNDTGYKVKIKTTARKTVDNVVVETEDVLEIYIMEYVVNYGYVEGVNEDIVKGMENGVISTAIGNPYQLEFAIRNFLEYDKNNAVVNAEVDLFVEEMTKNIEWKVHFNGKEELLANGKTIREDFYYINSLTVTPLKIYNHESDIYHFSAGAYFTMKNGTYSHSSIATNSNRLYTEFAFDVHNQSTQDSPIPIETYEDLLAMEDGEYYILLRDIVLPNEDSQVQFMPLNKAIKGLDGNGYSIVFSGIYNFPGISQVGLFDKVDKDVLLKNITISLTNDVVFRMDSASFKIGLLAASNHGIVTNCQVQSIAKGTSSTSLSVLSSVTTNGAYVAGLVGENSGDITHSRSKVNIISYVNMAGLVGVNNGSIASSYYKEGRLVNQTNTTNEFTAGLVVTNNGEIYTSYVSGVQSKGSICYKGLDDYLQSSNNIAGFVYENSGEISDCYSNIKIKQTGKFASGFVYDNTGTIQKCFSTSELESYKTSNYGFARVNRELGLINNCFYLSDANLSGTAFNVNISDINNDDGRSNITKLTAKQFGIYAPTDADLEDYLAEYFYEFAYDLGRGVNSVWFYDDGSGDEDAFDGAEFNVGRLELVAPNIEAYSRRNLESVENVVDEQSGATYVKYVYIYDANANALGSFYNPITISSAQELETYITQENNAAGFNYASYRLVRDVDYSEYLYNSKLYKTKFVGYLEGNFKSINGINLLSSDALNFAGLFAEVGSSTIFDANGTLLNFDFKPSIVSFANASVVGSLAGKVDGANIVNVNINQTNETIVVGNNIVGGAVGMALGDYNIQDVYCKLSAKARNQKTKEGAFTENSDYSQYSIAGTLAGVLAGSGKVYNTSIVDAEVSVLAGRAGLLVGFVGSGVQVEKVVVEVNNQMLVNAYKYGGLVVGQTQGWFKDVEIVGSQTTFENFKKLPYSPDAVGVFAGLVSGGRIENVRSTQSVKTATSSDSEGIEHVGAIVGQVSGAAVFKDIVVENASVVGYQYVGGVVGSIAEGAGIVSFENVYVSGGGLRVEGRMQTEVAIGGLVGMIGQGSSVWLSQSELENEYQNELNFIKGEEGLLKEIADVVAGTWDNDMTVFENYEKKESEYIKKGFLTASLGLSRAVSNGNAEVSIFEAAKATIENQLIPAIEMKMFEECYNYFDVEVGSMVYVYGTTIDTFVGGIVGADLSANQSFVERAYSSISGTCRAYNMSGVFATTSYTASVVDGAFTKPANAPIKEYLFSATDTRSAINIVFDTTDEAVGSSVSCDISITCFGQLA